MIGSESEAVKEREPKSAGRGLCGPNRVTAWEMACNSERARELRFESLVDVARHGRVMAAPL